MASYKYPQYVVKIESPIFDELHTPGTLAPYSGIYRCMSCGDEDACNKGKSLPPQNHAQHDPSKGAIRWKLTVFAVQKK